MPTIASPEQATVVRATTRALDIIDTYRKGNDPDAPVEEVVVDILSDLFVYAGSWGSEHLDTDYIIEAARMHADEELEGWVA